jgi:hypothetical protein
VPRSIALLGGGRDDLACCVWPPETYDGLAQVRRTGKVATAALGTADSMIEWRYFDLEATVYGTRA